MLMQADLAWCMQFLCNGLEDDFGLKRHAAGDAGTELERLIQSSGKMLLLHKLLPKLKAEGHRVSILYGTFLSTLSTFADSWSTTQIIKATDPIFCRFPAVFPCSSLPCFDPFQCCSDQLFQA